MSWYKKFKIHVVDETKKFKSFMDEPMMAQPSVSDESLPEEQDQLPQQETPQQPQPQPQSAPVSADAQTNALEFRESMRQNCISYIANNKAGTEAILKASDPAEADKIIAKMNKNIIGYCRDANQKIEAFNNANPGFRIQILSPEELGLPNAEGVMGSLLLPFAGKGHLADGTEDKNVPALIDYIQKVIAANNITDDKDGAELLAEFAADKNHPDVRLLVNDYFKKTGRQNFHELLSVAGYPGLADAFSEIADKDLNYRDFGQRRTQAKVVDDEVFGEDYGLQTRSEAERQILSIFRGLDLQPIPAEIKMPSTKVKKGSKDINTEFMCDFLLPCEVLVGTNEDGSPNIKSQVVFVGEYFGWYGSDYENKTSMKEELEPFQAVLTGNDVIFITKDDFAAGGNALKLINQLEAKSIIFKGSKSKQIVDEWLSGNKKTANPDVVEAIESRTQKLTPELAIVKAAKLQLQFKFGEIAQFYQNYANPENSDYQQMVTSLFNQYTSLKLRADELNKAIRAKQHRKRVEASSYTWQDTLKLSGQKEGNDQDVLRLMGELQDVNNQIRKVYVDNEKVVQIKQAHETALLNDPEYQARNNELNILEDMLIKGSDPLPQENASIGRKVSEICNNALAGLGVSLTRQTKQLPKQFQSMLVTALSKYRRFINSFNLDELI
jgi:hypothetical protein